MDESEFQLLLQLAEPRAPVIDTSEIALTLTAMETEDHGIGLPHAASPTDVIHSRRNLLAVGSMFVALTALAISLAFLPEMESAQAGDDLLREYQICRARTEALEAELRKLSGNQILDVSAAKVAEIRASESLWMVMEADESNQRMQAETIVSLYGETPAASRCRRLFPDIIYH